MLMLTKQGRDVEVAMRAALEGGRITLGRKVA